MKSGIDSRSAAQTVGTSARKLEEITTAPDPVGLILGIAEGVVTAERIERARLNVGQLIVGKAAELAFEDIYRTEVQPSEFTLKDMREGRSDTDYRLLNGSSRPVYRINIKFSGSVFRRAPELVGLEPNDCFPLATYKIHLALQKQHDEHLPYIFVIVGVPDLRARVVGAALSTDEVIPVAWLMASDRVPGKRNVEDRFVDVVAAAREPAFLSTYERIRAAPWFVLSARRADKLLRELLFERVYAMRIRGFAQQFRGAELDMHFSLARDLRPLKEFLAILREGGLQRATSMLERGDI